MKLKEVGFVILTLFGMLVWFFVQCGIKDLYDPEKTGCRAWLEQEYPDALGVLEVKWTPVQESLDQKRHYRVLTYRVDGRGPKYHVIFQTEGNRTRGWAFHDFPANWKTWYEETRPLTK